MIVVYDELVCQIGITASTVAVRSKKKNNNNK